ncbi:cell division protein FtsZ [Megalodesulfovibrio gigas]|uniref:Cell division protein FtsZ n=1 Tax=Megalodesulfovibrio gigas (strain ATCC 19364 / DSM 1382 / NCIMB 9332 / VKM B-1759) TaxID=1121448 RepID=T2G7U9_MEGG1|nr:cell division protein FtsZ [Megalodesulfovibrio gigas]AGW12264.1 putative cell division protein FtsZ [Megalodesulfovibrio gigas DSM 1382 = ATCC 19364]
MEFQELEGEQMAKIKVIGVGGGGGNAVNNMIASALKGVRFVTANTDIQALARSKAEFKIQLGEKLTKGLGAGANPEVGRDATLESMDQVKKIIGDADMVFVTAGMGGGTGTGSAPVIAQCARDLGALTVGVVTKPFYFEGKKRKESAERGIAELRQHVDSLITIPNDRLLALAAKKATFIEMLKKADEVLYYAVKGISDLIMLPGLINLDFADVKAVMGEMGLAMMGTGIARGENRAREAAMKAITSPLLEDVSIEGAKGVLMNITCGPDLTIDEVSEAASTISEAAHEDARIFFGTVFDQDSTEEMRITVIATGIETAAEMAHVAMPGMAQGLTRAQLQQAREGGQGGNVTPLRGAKPPARPAPQPPVRGGYGGQGGPGGPGGPGGGNGSAMAHEGLSPMTPGLKARKQAGLEDEWSIPAYLRYRKGQEDAHLGPMGSHAPGEDDFVFDEDEFEIPSFIRKQAD